MGESDFLRRVSSVTFLLILFSVIVAFHTEAYSKQKRVSDVWVVYQGRDQFKLGAAKQIPLSELVKIRAYEVVDRLPIVRLINLKTTDTTNLVVTFEPGVAGWSASLPRLDPNTPATIQIDRFLELNVEDKSESRNFVIQALTKIRKEENKGELYGISDNSVFLEGVAKLLRSEYQQDLKLSQFVVLSAAGDPEGSILEALIKELTSRKSLEVFNAISNYDQALFNLSFILDKIIDEEKLSSGAITTKMKIVIEFLKEIPVELRDKKKDFRNIHFNKLMLEKPDLIPLDDTIVNALTKVLRFSNEKELITKGQLDELLEDVEVLHNSIDKEVQKIFDRLKVLHTKTYTFSSSQTPLIFADIARLGTIDFVGAYIPGMSQTRGMLTLSFFPGGPKSRTPLANAPQWAPTIGYSVTGGEEEDPSLVLIGITVRFNRTVNVVLGAVTDANNTKIWYGTVGITGDLTSIPFLKDLFTVQ